MSGIKEDPLPIVDKFIISQNEINASSLLLAKNENNSVEFTAEFFSGIDPKHIKESESLSSKVEKCEGCKKRKKYIVSIHSSNRIRFICSIVCIRTFLNEYKIFLQNNIQAYNRESYNVCEKCKVRVSTDYSIAFYKKFCTDRCLLEYCSANYSSCYICVKNIDKLDVGKFCFYRNKIFYQLCGSDCQSRFKQLKLCYYCAGPLTKESMFTVIISRVSKYFCNKICYKNFRLFNERTDFEKRHCAVCQEYDIRGFFIEIQLKAYKIHVCSKVCFFVFFELNTLIDSSILEPYIVCMNCRKIFLLNNNIITAFNQKGVFFPFCSEMCKWAMISKSGQGLISCNQCLSKKHYYDLFHFHSNGKMESYCCIRCRFDKENPDWNLEAQLTIRQRSFEERQKQQQLERATNESLLQKKQEEQLRLEKESLFAIEKRKQELRRQQNRTLEALEKQQIEQRKLQQDQQQQEQQQLQISQQESPRTIQLQLQQQSQSQQQSQLLSQLNKKLPEQDRQLSLLYNKQLPQEQQQLPISQQESPQTILKQVQSHQQEQPHQQVQPQKQVQPHPQLQPQKQVQSQQQLQPHPQVQPHPQLQPQKQVQPQQQLQPHPQLQPQKQVQPQQQLQPHPQLQPQNQVQPHPQLQPQQQLQPLQQLQPHPQIQPQNQVQLHPQLQPHQQLQSHQSSQIQKSISERDHLFSLLYKTFEDLHSEKLPQEQQQRPISQQESSRTIPTQLQKQVQPQQQVQRQHQSQPQPQLQSQKQIQPKPQLQSQQPSPLQKKISEQDRQCSLLYKTFEELHSEKLPQEQQQRQISEQESHRTMQPQSQLQTKLSEQEHQLYLRLNPQFEQLSSHSQLALTKNTLPTYNQSLQQLSKNCITIRQPMRIHSMGEQQQLLQQSQQQMQLQNIHQQQQQQLQLQSQSQNIQQSQQKLQHIQPQQQQHMTLQQNISQRQYQQPQQSMKYALFRSEIQQSMLYNQQQSQRCQNPYQQLQGQQIHQQSQKTPRSITNYFQPEHSNTLKYLNVIESQKQQQLQQSQGITYQSQQLQQNVPSLSNLQSLTTSLPSVHTFSQQLDMMNQRNALKFTVNSNLMTHNASPSNTNVTNQVLGQSVQSTQSYRNMCVPQSNVNRMTLQQPRAATNLVSNKNQQYANLRPLTRATRPSLYNQQMSISSPNLSSIDTQAKNTRFASPTADLSKIPLGLSTSVSSNNVTDINAICTPSPVYEIMKKVSTRTIGIQTDGNIRNESKRSIDTMQQESQTEIVPLTNVPFFIPVPIPIPTPIPTSYVTSRYIPLPVPVPLPYRTNCIVTEYESPRQRYDNINEDEHRIDETNIDETNIDEIIIDDN